MHTKELDGFPGGDLVRQGIADLRRGATTVPGCLVRIARTRLQYAAIIPKDVVFEISTEPERDLYRLLLAEPGDAYSRYNSLIRELVSFENAVDSR